MHKLYTELLGMPVFEEDAAFPFDYVRDLIIDPENGKLLAFLLSKNSIIVPLDIKKIGSGGVFVHDKRCVLETNEVLRVKKVFERGISIFGAKVIAQSGGEYLGRVVDCEIDTADMFLRAIHVAKMFLLFRFNERIISYKHIVRITKHAVIVKGSQETVLAKQKQTKITKIEEAFAA